MRALIGLSMVVAAGLGGVEYLSAHRQASGQSVATSEGHFMQATSVSLMAPSYGGVVQTVAATQAPTLPPVTVAPDAPHAEPINPIVAPVKKAMPKSATHAKSAVKSAPAAHQKTKVVKTKPRQVAVTRAGFKLSCTPSQKLDVAKQKCVASKR